MAFFKKNNYYYIADSVEDLKNIQNPEWNAECFVIKEACEYKCTSKKEWVKQIVSSTASNNEINLENYATKEYVDEAINATKSNTIFGESDEAMANNPGSAFGISVNADDTRSICDIMLEKGIGLYTFWINKNNPDLPEAVKEKKSSCRGLCCVDTVKETGWYGWIQLFDHDGFMYSRYIRNSTPTEWRAYNN